MIIFIDTFQRLPYIKIHNIFSFSQVSRNYTRLLSGAGRFKSRPNILMQDANLVYLTWLDTWCPQPPIFDNFNQELFFEQSRVIFGIRDFGKIRIPEFSDFAIMQHSIPLIITTLGILGASLRTCKSLSAYVLLHNIPVSRLENLYVYFTTTY